MLSQYDFSSSIHKISQHAVHISLHSITEHTTTYIITEHKYIRPSCKFLYTIFCPPSGLPNEGTKFYENPHTLIDQGTEISLIDYVRNCALNTLNDNEKTQVFRDMTIDVSKEPAASIS